MYTGLTGKVKIGADTAAEIAYISNWSVEDTVELIEVSELGKRTKGKLAGLRGWTASAEGAIEFSDAEKGHKALFEAMHNGNEVVCEFYLDSSTKFSGTGLIESLSIDLSAEDKGNVSISISGTDELIYPGKPETP
ncbi:MAG: phage tail tube protein [Christensenellales bacterium]|jgi:phage major tail protein 2|nr:MAG TPA: major tail protein [Bacteriophage sp.]DAP31257.1 MAG TPA: major tail protein [Caudoviricetes sp.]